MKKLERFGPTIGEMIARPIAGVWVKHDDAMAALADRQSVLDARTGERDRLQTCVEVADRMRAMIADDTIEWDEAREVAKLYDDARRRTLGTSPRPLDVDIDIVRQLVDGLRMPHDVDEFFVIDAASRAAVADALAVVRDNAARRKRMACDSCGCTRWECEQCANTIETDLK